MRAYATDLTQAFDLENLKDWKNCRLNELAVEATQINEERLLDLVRKAQTKWERLAPASRRRKAACLKSFLQWLYENEITRKNLAFKVILTQSVAKLPRFLSVDEAIALLQR